MARLIPNENTWVGFTPAVAATTLVPKLAEITAASDLTKLLISLNASTQGNSVPTPAISSLFDTSIPGTVQASFTADFYRDDVAANDIAWTTLPRKTAGFMIVSRWGGKDATTPNKPTTGDTVEVWPIKVVSRTMSNLGSNTVMTFTVTCTVTAVPNEAAVITAT